MNAPITTTSFPRSRLSTIDLGRLSRDRHHGVALLEIDVTRARTLLRSRKRSGDSSISFLAWLAKSVASSLARHPAVHAVRTGRRRIAQLPDVTASLLVEREVDGRRVPLPFVVRSADSRALAEIEGEIAAARTTPVDPRTVIVGGRARSLLGALYCALPGFVRRGVLKRAIESPRRVHRTMGSVVITSIGMGGRVRGWFIPRTLHPVCIGVGSVAPKASVINGTIEAREVLHLTVLVDHDVVDGAPAARWISDLARALEQAKELSPTR